MLDSGFEARHAGSARIRRLAVRLPVSAGLMVGLLAGCLRLPHADHATVGLLMIALTAGLATVWGRMEALVSAVIGGIGFDYYFLPPRGFGIAQPEHLVALATFLFVAAAIGQLAARSRQLLAQRNSLLDLSLDPLCITDLNGDFRSVNEAMVNVLGWPATELCAKPFLEFVHPDDQEQTKDGVLNASSGRPVELENRYRTRHGEWRWLHWKIAPPAPEASWLSAAAHDVTEEKRIQDKLRDLADRVMTAQEEERSRVARELHDDVTQRLATIGIELGLIKRSAVDENASARNAELSRIQAQIIQLSEDVRGLSHALHPSLLEQSDLATSLETHCRDFGRQNGIDIRFTSRDVPANIPPLSALALYRIAQESLRNVVRHSGATEASVVLAGDESNQLSLFVIDNGKGFDPAAAKTTPGLGLLNMEERARQIGATMTIESLPEAGTRLTVRLPKSEITGHET